MKMSDDYLEVWVIYEHPNDYPNHFVTRKQVGIAVGKYAYGPPIISESLEEARQKVPEGLFKFIRHPGDDPCIVETWI